MGKINAVYLENELQSSYLDYAMSVIISRAIPDVRDGLKPVQRRILYGMYTLNNLHNQPTKKSARIVGTVMGQFHPHGDLALYEALVRMAQDFSTNHVLVEGQGNFGCFTKNTKIRLTDGRGVDFEQLIKEQAKGIKHWTFTFNTSANKIEIAEIKNPRLTRKAAPLVEVVLDNDERIRCTPDHRFLVRSGEYRQAKDLKSGDSLMPLYIQPYGGELDKNLKDYETVLQPIQNEWHFVHHLSDDLNLKEGRCDNSTGRVRHHIDLHFVSSLNNKYPQITPEIYESERKNDGTPKIGNALKYFANFEQIIEGARTYNHKVKEVLFLSEHEDVYDLTVGPWHNFALFSGVFVHNSMDGDPPAAMRYTEVRLAKVAEELLNDLDKETVSFVPNFDNTETEPEVLPAAFPNLLVNGASGIAVGVSTSMPPHNLGEVCDAIVHVLTNKEATVDELMTIIKGPDFPTGGIAIMSGSAYNGYRYGKGQLTIKAKVEIDEKNEKHRRIVVKEMPYNTNKASFVENVANLVRDKKITGIRDIRDESDKNGVSVVIELKEDANAQQVQNLLFKHTQLEVTFPLINLAVLGKTLRSMNLLQLLTAFVAHRREVITRRSSYELRVAKERLHIVDGLLIAISKIDAIIKTIKESSEVSEARANLMSGYGLTETQSNAILEMKLSRLTKLENTSLNKEKGELEIKIKYYSEVLADPGKIDEIIRNETLEIKKKYARPRRTEIVYEEQPTEILDEDLIVDEKITILMTNLGYVKRLNITSYKEQERGGKGIIAMNLKEGDFIKCMITTNSKDYLLFISDLGRVYWLKAYNVPEGTRYSEGRSVANLLNLENEKAITMFSIRDFSNSQIVFLTAKGLVKKTDALLFSRPRSTGVRALTLNKGDTVADVSVFKKEDVAIITTANGKAIQFKVASIRSVGRTAAGVRGIRLRNNDVARNIMPSRESGSLLTISEKGYGKITEIRKYRLQGRGGGGVLNLKVNDKTGLVAKSLVVGNETRLLLLNSSGVSITIPMSSIRVTGRAASGVKLMKLDPCVKVIDARILD